MKTETEKGGDVMVCSEDILLKALQQFNPKKVFIATSGGDDSITALNVFCELNYIFNLGIKPIILHINTGLGVQRTTDFVREMAKKMKLEYAEMTNYAEYEQRVIERGFYGQGVQAHRMAYNILKDKPFRRAIGKYRQGKHNYKVLIINGARKQESDRRMKTSKDINVRNSDIWVNLVNDWSKTQELEYLDVNKIERNPACQVYCRSAECNCGTPISKSKAEMELAELKHNDKECYDKIMALQEKILKAGHCFGWGVPKPKWLIAEQRGQQSLFKHEEMPMCQSCNLR